MVPVSFVRSGLGFVGHSAPCDKMGSRLRNFVIIAVCRIVGAAAFLALIAFFCPSRRNITFQSYLLCFPIKLRQILYVYNRLIISEMRAAISKSHEQVFSSSKFQPE